MNAETPREILREEDKMAERQEVKRSQNPNLTMKNGKMNVVQRRKSCSLVGYWRIDQTVSGSCIICIFLLVYVKIEKCNTLRLTTASPKRSATTYDIDAIQQHCSIAKSNDVSS